jgi:hypothetical protein
VIDVTVDVTSDNQPTLGAIGKRIAAHIKLCQEHLGVQEHHMIG